MFDFRFNTQIPSQNQGQGSVFKVRECAQSIPRIKLPLESHLLKNFSELVLTGGVTNVTENRKISKSQNFEKSDFLG